MERVEDPRLQSLREAGARIYSISRLNTMAQCPYQSYLNYVKQEPQKMGIWSSLGGRCHDALQACIDTHCDESIILKAIQEELDDLEMIGVEFPLDKNGNPTIKNNYIANMTRFAKEFKTPKGKFETEQLIIYPIPNRPNCYMQGYIDVIKYENDSEISIIDWKTSSQFSGEHLIESGRQLVLYGLAKQAEGFKIKRLMWVMLKYCVTSWTLKNGKTKEKISEWRNLVKDLRSTIEKKLSDAGYDDFEIDMMLTEAQKDNTLDSLPEEIRSQFKTRIYVREYEFSQENIDETLDYICRMVDKYETAGEDEANYPPCEIDKKTSFFCNSLCGYGYEKCKYYRDYCEQNINEKEDDDDLF